MKKLLLLAALMLTANIVTAESIDPCEDIAGNWFGLRQGVAVTANIKYMSQEQAVYLETFLDLKEVTRSGSGSSTVYNYYETETLKLFGSCRGGVLDFKDTTMMECSTSYLHQPGNVNFYSLAEPFKGNINNKKITLSGSLGSNHGGVLTYVLYKEHEVQDETDCPIGKICIDPATYCPLGKTCIPTNTDFCQASNEECLNASSSISSQSWPTSAIVTASTIGVATVVGWGFYCYNKYTKKNAVSLLSESNTSQLK